MHKCSIESKYDGDQLSHNNSTLYQTILMTFNNEIPSFYNKANQKSINGESHCFNVSVETNVPLLSVSIELQSCSMTKNDAMRRANTENGCRAG